MINQKLHTVKFQIVVAYTNNIKSCLFLVHVFTTFTMDFPWKLYKHSCKINSKKWLFRTFTMDFFIKSYISTHSRLFWKKNDSFGKCLQRFIPQLTFKLLPWQFTGTPWRTLIYFLRQGFFNNRTVFYFPELIWMTVSKYHLRNTEHTFCLLSTTFFNRRYHKVDLLRKGVLEIFVVWNFIWCMNVSAYGRSSSISDSRNLTSFHTPRSHHTWHHSRTRGTFFL